MNFGIYNSNNYNYLITIIFYILQKCPAFWKDKYYYLRNILHQIKYIIKYPSFNILSPLIKGRDAISVVDFLSIVNAKSIDVILLRHLKGIEH